MLIIWDMQNLFLFPCFYLLLMYGFLECEMPCSDLSASLPHYTLIICPGCGVSEIKENNLVQTYKSFQGLVW